ncbi:MAG: FadR/GntR family transcriptional regulator [Streptosporangiaceae bacterium]
MEVERHILEGRLREGDHLPGERRLAELLGVSRGGVREALRVLEALGVLTAGTGSGPEAGSIVAGNPSEAMTPLLRLHHALSGFTVEEMVETRIVLEGWAAREAARHRDASSWRGLEQPLEAADDQDITTRHFVELDAQFHVGLAKASGNRLIGYFMQSLRDTMLSHMDQGFEELSDVRTVIASLRREHREIYDQVRAGDGAKAAEHIERHIRSFYAGHIPRLRRPDRE